MAAAHCLPGENTVALRSTTVQILIASSPDLRRPRCSSSRRRPLVGHRHPIIVKDSYGRVHPEPELAVVIGRAGADIPVESAMDHIFGYTIVNDITSPTMRAETRSTTAPFTPASDNPRR